MEMQRVEIKLSSNQTLYVDLHESFYTYLSTHFKIPVSEITHDHIRMFFWGALNSAIENAQKSD
jgi:hypothetical protein